MKQKYRKKSKLCYVDTDTFIVNVKTDDIKVDITKDVEPRFNTSN